MIPHAQIPQFLVAPALPCSAGVDEVEQIGSRRPLGSDANDHFLLVPRYMNFHSQYDTSTARISTLHADSESAG